MKSAINTVWSRAKNELPTTFAGVIAAVWLYIDTPDAKHFLMGLVAAALGALGGPTVKAGDAK